MISSSIGLPPWAADYFDSQLTTVTIEELAYVPNHVALVFLARDFDSFLTKLESSGDGINHCLSEFFQNAQAFILFRNSVHNQDSIQAEFKFHNFLPSFFAAKTSTYVDLVCEDMDQMIDMPRWMHQETQ